MTDGYMDPALLYVRWIRPIGPVVAGAMAALTGLVSSDDGTVRDGVVAMVAGFVGLFGILLVRRLEVLRVVRLVTWFDVAFVTAAYSLDGASGSHGAAFLWPLLAAAMLLRPRDAVWTGLGLLVGVVVFGEIRGDLDWSSYAASAIGVIAITALLAMLRTNEHRVARERADLARQLDAAQRLARVGSFEFGVDDDVVAWSPQTRRLYGVDEGVELGVERLRALVHPDDIPLVGAAFVGAFERAEPFELDMRINRADDGDPRVLHLVGRAVDGVVPPRLFGTVQDVTDLRRLDAMREEFVAAASHELRTPTSIVLGFATTLTTRWDELADSDRREFAREIDDAARRLSLLVEDVLQATQIESSTVSCKSESFDLREEVLEVVATWPGKTPIRVGVDEMGNDGSTFVIGDRLRTRQVLGNLLDNAERHARDATRVHVQIRPAFSGGSVVTACVIDDGRGVPAVDRDRIFERFVRLDRSVVGTGLGLYISRRLAEAQGGSLVVEDAPGEHGAAFAYSLPADSHHGLAATKR